MKKNLIKSVIFCICLFTALTLISKSLSFKYLDGIGQWDRFYAEKTDIDVLLLGASHSIVHINPVILYHERGITSYCIGARGETVWATYYNMEEALKYVKPKVVFVEICMAPKGELYDDSHNINATFGMKRSLTWFKDVMESVPENKAYYLTRFPFYHTRYRSLTREDFKSGEELYKTSIKGFLVDDIHWNVVKMPDESEMRWTDEGRKDPLPERSTKYVEKIIELANNNNMKLVFIITPYYTTIDYARAHNSVNEYIDNENVFFWNCNKDVAEIGLDNETDFRHETHLNWSGSMKLSKYLAKRMDDTFELDDHRGEEKYKSYQEDYEYYMRLVEENTHTN